MAPKVNLGTMLILDIGKNVAGSGEKDEKTFFKETLECTARLIERKIMSQAKHLVGVLLIGSKKTKNNMAEQAVGAFRRIELLSELQTPTWKMIKDLPQEPTNKQGDWLEALVVAADHFNNGVSGVKIESKKIILMTNFKAPTQLADDVEQILNGLKADGFEIDIIGPDIYEENNSKDNDYELARQFLEATNGATAPFEDTMKYLQFHRKKITKPMPWNVDLSIGPNLKIPITAFIRQKDEPIVKNWNKAVKDPVTLSGSSTEVIMREKVHLNTENEEEVEPTEVIKGFKYGQQIIPLDEYDKTMLYDSGNKGLFVYGFTHASNITWQNLTGDGLFYIFGRKGNKKAINTIHCLVECLHELQFAGLVRRVYNKGNAPKMFALMPVIDSNNFICLSMAEVCFKEEIKIMSFPPTSLKKYNTTNDQVNAFKDLIKAMDLTKAYDESYDEAEAFPVAETVNPSAQYMLDCIAFRALNPNEPLPQPRDEIMQLFKQPPMIEKRSREPLDKIKKLFPLNKVEAKSKNRRDISANTFALNPSDPVPSTSADVTNGGQNINDGDKLRIQLPKITDEITKIGTKDPVHDFEVLKGKGRTLAELSPGMTDAMEALIYVNIDGQYSKGINAMQFFREQCVKEEPSPYNDWLKNFKITLINRKKDDVLGLITENNLNFILKSENSLSTIDDESCGDTQLYENDTIPNSMELSLKTDLDVFDMM